MWLTSDRDIMQGHRISKLTEDLLVTLVYSISTSLHHDGRKRIIIVFWIARFFFLFFRSHAIEWIEEKKGGGGVYSFLYHFSDRARFLTDRKQDSNAFRRLSRRCSSFSFAFKSEIIFRKNDTYLSETRPP
jgi:hypothetical protein